MQTAGHFQLDTHAPIFSFKLRVERLNFVIAPLDSAQHPVKAIYQLADLVLAVFACAQGVIAVLFHCGHGVAQMKNRRGNHPLQGTRKQQGQHQRDHRHQPQNDAVALQTLVYLAQICLNVQRANGFSV